MIPNPQEISETAWVELSDLEYKMMREPDRYTSWFMIAAPKVFSFLRRRSVYEDTERVGQIFRVGEWYDSKVPMLLLPALYIMIIEGTASAEHALGNVILLLIFDSVFLAFGYLINDYADMDVDKRLAKRK